MGTLLASSLIADARRILLDPSPGVTWTDAALLKILNKGERAIVAVKHEAYTKLSALTLVAGVHQVLPADGVGLLDLYENVASGSVVRLVDRSLLDAAAPLYPAATQEADVQEWAHDKRDPTRFRVLPPNDGTGSVRALYGAVPVAIAAVGNAINLRDDYEGALLAFMVATCYAENSQRQDLAKSSAYSQEWRSLVGLGSQSQVAVSPNVGAQGGTK